MKIEGSGLGAGGRRSGLRGVQRLGFLEEVQGLGFRLWSLGFREGVSGSGKASRTI